ncbi:MAG: hypothetical protein JW821_09885 [Deltaproteobacteria bacterium]|nr:hypothetical protein [Deltaproteobacteria bacterium]
METVQTDSLVTLSYVMRTRFPDGAIKEHPPERIRFIFGVDRQVSTLEAALEGCAVGQRKSLALPAAELYGEHDPSLIREIPKAGLIKQRLREGQFYRQMKMGTLVSFKVLEVKEKSILADFNRPMAGVRVWLEFEVLDIREATGAEIDAAVEAQIKRSIGCG